MQISVSEASRNLSHWVNQASYARECVVLTSHGRAKAVIISVEALETLIGLNVVADHPPMALPTLRREFRAALAKAGVHTRDDMVELVRAVKQEMAQEREQEIEAKRP
jgi:prevent-host-death family protein